MVVAVSEPSSGWRGARETAQLVVSDRHADTSLGSSLAISGSTIVAGDPQQPSRDGGSAGALYVWSKPRGGWRNATQTAELTASVAPGKNQLGTSVAISGSTIWAGEPQTAATLDGAVLFYREPAGGWMNATETGALQAADNGSNDQAGSALAASNRWIVAGAPGLGNHGAIYVFPVAKARPYPGPFPWTIIIVAVGAGALLLTGILLCVLDPERVLSSLTAAASRHRYARLQSPPP